MENKLFSLASHKGCRTDPRLLCVIYTCEIISILNFISPIIEIIYILL
jgi:hypothetical protein